MLVWDKTQFILTAPATNSKSYVMDIGLTFVSGTG